MSRTILLQPTTQPAESAPVVIPSLPWSPDPALCATTRLNEQGQPTPYLYDGSELAPRAIRVMLFADRGQELPADAILRCYVKTFEAYSDGETYHPAQYEPLPCYDLTPTRKFIGLRIPIEGMIWRKDETEAAYGLLSFGFGQTATSSH